jgi:hypothetical protein
MGWMITLVGLYGSIANFRVYGKALNADQVRELYEYDAERFGHRQNLVALHKGNLGVGVPNPTSRFEVAGADGLQEFPPKAMTGFETYMEGHGVFRASGSSFVDASVSGGIWTQDFPTWYAFNKSNTQGWITDVSKYTDGIADSDSDNRFGIRGEWLEIEMPSKIKLKHFTLSLAYDGGDSSDDPLITSRFPKVFNLYKSNDGITWTSATEITTPTAPVLASYGSTQQYDIDENEYYNRYLIQVKQTFADGTYTGSRSTHTAMGEWRLFGTPAPSSLEDGHLTLGKALTLPRVSGHPAGAETPRAESLVVHYDTTVDSVVSGSTVVDISGTGVNGTLNGDAAYSSTDRALTFDGVNDYVSGTLNNPAGAWVHTVSMWLKYDGTTVDNIVFMAGSRETNKSFGLQFYTTGTKRIRYLFYGNDVDYNFTVDENTWLHITATYNGSSVASGRKVYINGKELSQTGTNGTIAALSVPVNAPFRFANNLDGANDFNGSISNFKLWNVALTAEEVAAEYALGRTGKSLNLTDTALCLGGTVPRAQLDVRGSARVGTMNVDGNVGIGETAPSATLHIRDSSDNPVTTASDAVTHATQRIQVQNLSSMSLYTGSVTNGIHQQVANYSGTSTYALCLNPFGGNVGIGTTSPNAPLAVVSTRNADTWAADKSILDVLNYNGESATYGMSFAISQSQGDGIIQTFNRNTGVAEYDLRLQPSAGNVGIGTTNPIYKLDVYSNDGGTNIYQRIRANASREAGLVLERDDNNWQFVYRGTGYTNAENLTIRGGGTDGGGDTMEFTRSGNVGIGTTNPNYKLDVAGTVNTGALTATSATVPNDGDFVMGGKPLKPAVGLNWDRVNSRLEVNGLVGTSPTGGIIIPSGTTAQQPTGQTGMLRFNTTLGRLQVYDGTNWIVVGNISATGGTVTYVDGYTIHTFTSSDTFTVYTSGDVEYLVVAGGGGGGGNHGGAGGAGGYISGSSSIAIGAYTITVGGGGAGGISDENGTNGSNSVFNSLTALGGGGGGHGYSSSAANAGLSGGSGGGGAPFRAGGTTSDSAQGNNGGNGLNSGIAGHGGGGGGAGGAGGNALISGAADAGISGAGGIGLSSSITGTAVVRAGGGSGGRWGGTNTNPGTTGDVGTVQGGGGKGGAETNSGYVSVAGTANTGGGGGGGGDAGGSGAAGGSGIVIIRYLT